MRPVIERLQKRERVTRIVATGSSNTQRAQTNGNTQNWVDWVDMGLSWWYGRSHITINSGVSGETSTQILARFTDDVELFQPHVVFITCGGNDANPAKGVSLAQTKANLATMVERCRKIPDCHPILQTYYSADIQGLMKNTTVGYQDDVTAKTFPLVMQTVRDVAAETDCLLIDHLKRWEPLRLSDHATYRTLMYDLMHMSSLGHTVFGLDVLRALGVTPLNQWVEICAEAVLVQKRLDELSTVLREKLVDPDAKVRRDAAEAQLKLGDGTEAQGQVGFEKELKDASRPQTPTVPPDKAPPEDF